MKGTLWSEPVGLLSHALIAWLWACHQHEGLSQVQLVGVYVLCEPGQAEPHGWTLGKL